MKDIIRDRRHSSRRRKFLAQAAAGSASAFVFNHSGWLRAVSAAHANQMNGEGPQGTADDGANLLAAARQSTAQSMLTRGLMPVPARVEWQDGRLLLRAGFNVGFRGHVDARLQNAVTRMIERLARRTNLAMDPWLRTDPSVAALVMECRGPGSRYPELGENESYELTVSSRQAVLRAPTVVGALHGLETLLQLVEGHAQGYVLPSVYIADRPRFVWRGLLLDVSRHFQPIDVIRRTLDGMAAVKMNVFHWHLTDDQGFRAESMRDPRLTGLGSHGQFYTQDQMREIVLYACDRGIRVLPEFDMPAHTTSWMVGYPELGSAPGPYRLARRLGVHNAVFDPTRPELYRFLDDWMAEMVSLFPDRYFHIGGDENNGHDWNANPRIRRFMQRHAIPGPHALQAYFNLRLHPLIERHERIMVGWQEILDPRLPKSIVVEAWRSVGALASIVEQGFDGILAAGYYLDLMWPAAKHYAVDPIPVESSLNEEQQRKVLGGEACMWGEYVTPLTVDSRIWPRTAAIAERLWSPREITDVADMYRRLELVSLELEDRGLTHRWNQDRLLRWFARGEPVKPLSLLLDVIEPTKHWHPHEYTVFTPPDTMFYAAPPESSSRRWFPQWVDEFLAAPEASMRLDRLFCDWQQAHAGFERLLRRSSNLDPLEPLMANLTQLGAVGAAAVQALRRRRPLSEDWAAQARARLNHAARPHANLEFVILEPMQRLVAAAAKQREPALAAGGSGSGSGSGSMPSKVRLTDKSC